MKLKKHLSFALAAALLAALAASLPLPLLAMHQGQAVAHAQEAAMRSARLQFAAASPGHARLVAAYNSWRQHSAAYPGEMPTWAPSPCGRAALTLMRDEERQARHAVPLPWLIKMLRGGAEPAPRRQGKALANACLAELGAR